MPNIARLHEQIQNHRAQLERDRERLHTMRTQDVNLTAALSGMPHSGGVKNPIETAVIEMITLEDRIPQESERLHELECELRTAIWRESNLLERLVFIGIYVCEHYPSRIAFVLGISKRRVNQIRKNHLKNIGKNQK